MAPVHFPATKYYTRKLLLQISEFLVRQERFELPLSHQGNQIYSLVQPTVSDL